MKRILFFSIALIMLGITMQTVYAASITIENKSIGGIEARSPASVVLGVYRGGFLIAGGLALAVLAGASVLIGASGQRPSLLGLAKRYAGGAIGGLLLLTFALLILRTINPRYVNIGSSENVFFELEEVEIPRNSL